MPRPDWWDLSDDELAARLRQHSDFLSGDDVLRYVERRDDPEFAVVISEVLRG
jgi:hypothetical protein